MNPAACVCLLLAFVSPLGSNPQAGPGAAIVQEYRIGARDLLEISVFELPELSQTVRVSEDGSISLPLLGNVVIRGLTREEIEKKLAGLLLAENYVKNARVSVFIREYQSQRIALLGAVAKPGMYELVGRMTLLEAVSQAGGLTDRATREMFVLRKTKDGAGERLVVDLAALINAGDPALNIVLQPGDILTAPFEQTFRIFVFGSVRNPGALEISTSKGITLMQAVAQAGGPTEEAAKSGILITRRDPKTGRESKITANLNKILRGRRPDVALQEGDVVFVPESIF